MAGIVTQDEPDGQGDETDLSRDELFDILGHERRRCIIQYIQHESDTVKLGDLVDHVAAWENNKPIDDLTPAELKRVRTAVQQSHLPKMEEMKLVEYDPDSGVIEPSESFTDLNVYLQVVGGTMPYSLVYLVLSVVSAALVGGLWVELPILTSFPTVGWGALIVVLFGCTSLFHLYDTRRLELVPDFLSKVE